jgi:hypothetical protein
MFELLTKSYKTAGLWKILFLCIICLAIYIYYPRSVVVIYKPSPDLYVIHPYIAVLVEFRSTPLLVTIVTNVLHNIPTSWPIQIFHGEDNANFLRNSQLNKYIKQNRILLHQIDFKKGSNTIDYTNNLLTNITFWRMVKGEKILFFQLDSIFCSNSPHKLNDFLQYDYIGAPWHSQFKLPVKVGNGGFSLRSRSKLLALLSNHTFDHQYHEDVWFSRFLPLVNATIAPEEIAKKFSVETIFYATPLAVHKPIYLEIGERKALCKTCPELRIISPLCTG